MRGLDLMKNLFGYTCANSSVCVNVSVLAYFEHSKNTLVNEILPMVLTITEGVAICKQFIGYKPMWKINFVIATVDRPIGAVAPT